MSVASGRPITAKVPVVIVGAGPAGALLSHLLHLEGVDNLVLEHRGRGYVESRIRAGVLEQGTVDTLRAAGLGDRLDRDGDPHDGFGLAFGDRQVRIDLVGSVGKGVVIYGQTQVQEDLYAAADARGGKPIVFEAADVALHDLDGDRAVVTYTHDGVEHRVEADWVAGCDGSHGVSRTAIPAGRRRTFERTYPFGWLGILSRTPPVDDELIYAGHDRGFALCSMRDAALSRYYVQCPADDDVADWSDDRFWDELTARLPEHVADRLVTGPSIEKSIAPLRSVVTEPMRWGRLLLAGDAAHIVPPTGAKGLNLAVGDVTYLAEALTAAVRDGSTTGVDGYSERALRRVWQAVRFSWWMTTLLHRFPGQDDGFDQRVRRAELDHLAASPDAQRVLAANYVGLAL